MNYDNKEKLVAVLLSTFNGSEFLPEQLDSISKQTHPNVRVLARDDFSTDSTKEQLRKQQLKGNLSLLEGNGNIGAAASFLELLLHSPIEAEFFSFCDQDDIWYPDKLERAKRFLETVSEDLPAMYFSRVDCVDAQNQFIMESPIPRKVGFGNALVENVATGCTVVLNRAARNLIVKSIPDKCLMHDSWCYLVVSCFGKVLFDERPSMRYRQHSNNAIGAATSAWDNLVRRFRRLNLHKSGIFRFSDQAEKFLGLYGELIPEQKKDLLLKLVRAKRSFFDRLCLAVNRGIWRQSAMDNLILRVLILLNRY